MQSEWLIEKCFSTLCDLLMAKKNHLDGKMAWEKEFFNEILAYCLICLLVGW